MFLQASCSHLTKHRVKEQPAAEASDCTITLQTLQLKGNNARLAGPAIYSGSPSTIKTVVMMTSDSDDIIAAGGSSETSSMASKLDGALSQRLIHATTRDFPVKSQLFANVKPLGSLGDDTGHNFLGLPLASIPSRYQLQPSASSLPAVSHKLAVEGSSPKDINAVAEQEATAAFISEEAPFETMPTAYSCLPVQLVGIKAHPVSSATVLAGEVFSLRVHVTDAYGNTVAAGPGSSWTLRLRVAENSSYTSAGSLAGQLDAVQLKGSLVATASKGVAVFGNLSVVGAVGAVLHMTIGTSAELPPGLTQEQQVRRQLRGCMHACLLEVLLFSLPGLCRCVKSAGHQYDCASWASRANEWH